MLNQFKILIVDDQYYIAIADILAKQHLLRFKEELRFGEPSSINTQETDGMLVRVARRKNTPVDNTRADNIGAIDLIKKEDFDVFVLDIDLGDTHQGEAAAVGYGFEIWREAAARLPPKDKLFVLYTRSPEVIKYCGALCYDPNTPSVETWPLIIQFGTKNARNFEATEDEVDLLCTKTAQFLEQRAKEIFRESSITGRSKDELRSLLDALIGGSSWNIQEYERLKALDLAGWTVTTLFPRQILSIDANIVNSQLNGQSFSHNHGHLVKIKNLAFFSYGEVIFELLRLTHSSQYSNRELRERMEEEIGQGKVDHYIGLTDKTSNNQVWSDVCKELQSEFLPRLRETRLNIHPDKFADFFRAASNFSDFAKFIMQPSEVGQRVGRYFAYEEVQYLGWIRQYLYEPYGICITKQDIDLIEKILRANLHHNPLPVGKVQFRIDQIDNSLVYKVSDIPENWEDCEKHLDKVREGLNQPSVSEHLSELRDVVCGYYNGVIEFITPDGVVRKSGSEATKNDQIRTTREEGIVWKFLLPTR